MRPRAGRASPVDESEPDGPGERADGPSEHLADGDPWLEAAARDEAASRRTASPWVRAIGIVAVLAMIMLPLWNVLRGSTPQIADNGLEVCPIDYCVVQRAIEQAGLGITMAGASKRIVPDDETQAVVDRLSAVVDGPAVSVVVVDDLEGPIGGRYASATRTISVDRPATVWVLAHEVAHSVAPGHDSDFLAALTRIARALERGEVPDR